MTKRDAHCRLASEGISIHTYRMLYPATNFLPFISLTLGGGYGWLSAKHGMVIDNLEQVGHYLCLIGQPILDLVLTSQ